MEQSNRSTEQIDLVKTYCKENRLWRENEDEIEYTDVLKLDLSTVEPSVAGPKRPQDKIALSEFNEKFIELLDEGFGRKYIEPEVREEYISRWSAEGGSQPVYELANQQSEEEIEVKEKDGLKTVWISERDEKYMLSDGSVAIAAITSCTNTSNPFVMIGAGLVAQKAK